MTQSNFAIANEPGASYRQDVNTAFQALATKSSGTSAPATTYAYQEWYDTTNSLLKLRNGSNSAWITKGNVADSTILSYYINNAEAGRWTSTGLGIGTVAPAYKLDVTGDINLTGNLRISGVAVTFAEMANQTRNLTIPLNFAGSTDIVAASTTNLSAATGNVVNITGNTGITAYGTVQRGAMYILRFTGTPTITHNGTSLILLDTKNRAVTAGDIQIVYSEGSGNWREIHYWQSGMTPIQLLSTNNMLHVQDQKTANTNAGTSTAGATAQRNLNTVIVNTINGASLSSNQIILPAGTYFLVINVPAYSSGAHKGRLFNITDSAYTSLEGSATYATPGDTAQSASLISGLLTLTAQKTLEIRSYTVGGRATAGLGIAVNQGTEIYTDFKAWKIG